MALTIHAIKDILDNTRKADLPQALEGFRADGRAGVNNLITTYEKRYQAYVKELERLKQMRQYERKFTEKGFRMICGTDEAGRGPLAGPVCAAAVILPADAVIEGLNDSKKLNPARRTALYQEIINKAAAYSFCGISAAEIDETNIRRASLKAMKMAVLGLEPAADFVLVDGNDAPDIPLPLCTLVGGDGKSVSVAAASIIAKVRRDEIMTDYAAAFPGYGFETHKGYGTAEHIAAIKRLGACPMHRRSFLKDEWLKRNQ